MADLNILSVMIWGSAIALFYLAMNWLAGMMIQSGLLEPLGRGIQNVMPS